MMQFQSDILGAKVIRPKVTETTALGAAYLAGLAVGFWESLDEVKKQWEADSVFTPSMDEDAVKAAKAGWADASEYYESIFRRVSRHACTNPYG